MNTLVETTQQACDALINSGIDTDNNEGKLTDAAIAKLLQKLKDIFAAKGYVWSTNNLIGIRMDDTFTNQFSDFGIITMGDKLFAFPMSTKPGRYWLLHPEEAAGCGCLLEGQYKGMWQFHNTTTGWSGEPYMQQVANCTFIRQLNKNIGDSINRTITPITGMFGCNFHTWKGDNASIVGNLSAACQVMQMNIEVDEVLPYLTNAFVGINTYTLLHKNMF